MENKTMQRDKPKVLHHDRFTNTEGEQVNRLVLDANGHEVQILQFDDSPLLLVKVDDSVKQIDINKLIPQVKP